MLIILSPSKTIDTSIVKGHPHTQPKFTKESLTLVKRIKTLSTNELSKLMSISPKLAQQTYDRFQFWNIHHTDSNSKQAILSFKGEVYTGLNASSFTKDDLLYSQQHLIILSGLYGILRPLDLIQPYRLEIATNLSIRNHKDLYHFWDNKLTKELNRILKETSNDILINLASNEYFKSINKDKVRATFVTPIFKDNKNGQYKVISVYAKKARGAMSNFIIKNQIKNTEDLKSFSKDGYCFNNEFSNNTELVFTRG